MGDSELVDSSARIGAAADPFVGRQHELALLCQAFDDAAGGHGRLIMLVGEPGIGKTTLASEFDYIARQRGARVVWGRCWEGDGAPVFWPWVQVIRAYAATQDPATLREQMETVAPDLLRMVPDLARHLPEFSMTVADPEAARVRLFDAVVTFFRNAASRRALVVILDDLHRADDASLRLLDFLARESAGARILVVGSYRDTETGRDHPLSAVLGDVAAQNQSVALGGLSERDVSRLLEGRTGQAALPEVAAVVHARTEGNPLFVAEFVRLIRSDPDCDAPERVTTLLPRGVRDAIRLRCGHLSEHCQLVLSTAAAMGRDFDLDILARVAGAEILRSSSALDLLAALDEAIAAGLVSPLSSTPKQYRFSHVLVPDTLYGDLASSKRITLHLWVGRALEELRGAQLESRLAALAYHFGKAAAGGQNDAEQKAFEYAVKAGERAAGQLAYEEAALQYEAALQLRDSANRGNGPGGIVRRADLLIALGEAQGRAGETGKARATLLAAARLARA